MILTPGDPRELLPMDRLRWQVLGIVDAADESQDDRLREMLESAISTAEDGLSARILDGANSYRFDVGGDETIRIRERWHRSLTAVRFYGEGSDRTAPPAGEIQLAAIPSYTANGQIVLPPPAGRWPPGAETLLVETASGLDTTDPELGRVRTLLILLVQAEHQGRMEIKPNSAISWHLNRLRRGAWMPEVEGGPPPRADDFGAINLP